MNIKSLLTAASIVALTATSAHAIELTRLTQSDFEEPLAHELDLASTPVDGVVEAEISLTNGGDFPAGTNLAVVVTLPNGVEFNGALTGEAIFVENTEESAPAPNDDFDAANNDVAGTVFGTPSSSSAEFRIGVPVNNDTTTQFINLELPVSVVACPDQPITVTVETDGTPIEGDADGATEIFFQGCESAINGTLTSDDDEKEVLIGTTAGEEYWTLAAGDTTPATGPEADDTLGTVNFTIDPDVSTTEDAEDVDPAVDIDEIQIAVTVENTQGLTGFSLDTNQDGTPDVGPIAFGAGTNTATLSVLGTDFGDFPVDIIAVASGDAAIVTQNVTVDTIVVLDDTDHDFADNDDVDTDGTDDAVDGPIDSLDREGKVFGYFDWVGSNPDATITVLRVTGLPRDEDVRYTVNYINALDGSNGNYSAVASAADLADGELALFSHTGFGTSNTSYGRADVQICFETASEIVDVDRMMIRSGVVSAYNDGSNSGDTENGANNQPLCDDDNTCM